MTAQLFLFDTATLIDNLQLAFDLSATTGETVEVEETYSGAQVDTAIAALDALPEKQEEVYTGAQVGAAIAKLRMLPPKQQPQHSLAHFTVKELRELCKEHGMKGYSKLSKAQLMRLLERVSIKVRRTA